MIFVAALLAPLALLLPVAGAVEQVRDAGEGKSPVMVQAQAPVANQVRIEQRVTIRITPRPGPARPSMLMDLPTRPLPARLTEREIGRCLPIAGIAGVQATADNRLILYMRDRRVVSAALERSCRARDYYSGFYVERNSDGQICVSRDSLLSRSGANCKLSRIRQLVAAGN